MTTKLISNAIRDIIPTHPEPYPKELIDYSSSLYSSSKTRNCILKNQYELARYHICVYLTIEKFEKRLDLPEPIVDKIPIPRNLIRKTVLEFKKNLNLSSNGHGHGVTPSPSPRKIAILEKVKENSKKSDGSGHGIGSLMTPPTKRIRKLNDIESDSGEDNNDISDEYYSSDDSYTPKSRQTQLMTPNSSPSKNLKSKLLSAGSTKPKKRQMKKLTSCNSTTTSISTPLLISFCNRFDIPSDITKSILKTYANYYNRIKNPWGLLCGLVAVVYFKLNKDDIDNKLGFKIEFLSKLQLQQNGGLSQSDLQKWLKLINNLINSEKWFRDLDISSVNNKIEIPISLNSSTSMIDFNTMYFSPIYNEEFENWCNLHKF